MWVACFVMLEYDGSIACLVEPAEIFSGAGESPAENTDRAETCTVSALFRAWAVRAGAAGARFFRNSGKLSLVPYTKDFGRITHF